MSPTWISGTELLERWKNKGIELFRSVQEGLQPYTELSDLKPSFNHCLIHLQDISLTYKSVLPILPTSKSNALSIFIDEAMKATQESGKKNGFTYIFVRSEIMMYMDEKIDLTDEIVKLLNDKNDKK